MKIGKFNQYTKKEVKNITSNKIQIADSIEDLSFFIYEELNKKTSNNKIFLDKINKKLAKRIFKYTNLELFNYNISLQGNNIRKIKKSHGNDNFEKSRGQISVEIKDYFKIKDIIYYFDNIYISEKKKKEKTVIIFRKLIGKKQYNLVCVISNKHYCLEIFTMYINQKKNLATVKIY